MNTKFLPVLTIILSALAEAHLRADLTPVTGVRVPDGFEVTLFADEDLANDIYSLTVDPQGRVAVAGRGYVRLLLDHDDDGRADEARQFSDLPASGAQGMCFDGNDLVCTGDGAILRLRDADGDGRADGPPERLLAVKTGGEHDTHAVRKGPDGWWYVLAGNAAMVDSRFASLATSPIDEPRAGALYRLTPDFKQSEVLVDGFRNAYDFAFNPLGDLFVYDSDGERYVSLPWYQPTRLFHALPGSSAGWISLCWIRPDYFPDMPPVVGRFGRGSPTGVECYRHTQFPTAYHGAVFIADWTFGRVIAVPLVEQGSTYRSQPIEFMTGLGDFGFAPTDLAVAPDGSLLVSVGGRGTRGSVYRVRYLGEGHAKPMSTAALTQCLAAPQPLAVWSRAAWTPLADDLGRDAIARAALDDSRPDNERVRAIEILVERFGGLDAGEISQLAGAGSPRVRARAAWALRYLPSFNTHRGIELAETLLQDEHSLVARAILEALLGVPSAAAAPHFSKLLAAKLASDDPYVRQTAARVAAELPAARFAEVLAACTSPRARLAAFHAASLSRRLDRPAALRLAARCVADKDLPDSTRLEAARVAQLALGDVGGGAGLDEVFEGYSGPVTHEPWDSATATALAELACAYPTGNDEVDRELGRSLALARVPDRELLGRVLDRITPASHPVEDIHQLIVAACLPVDRSAAQRETIAATLLHLDPKIRELRLNQDLHWDTKVGELAARLMELDEELPAAMVARPEFGRPGSLLLFREMAGATRAAALEKIVASVRADEAYPWSSDLVFALAESPAAEHRDLVRAKVDDPRIRGAVLIGLARQPQAADRPLFVAGLDSAVAEVLESCLRALATLPASDEAREQAVLVRLIRRLGSDKRDAQLRDMAVRLLARTAGRDFGYEYDSQRPQPEAVARWTRWLTEKHPELAAELLSPAPSSTVNVAALLEAVDWASGIASRGENLFAARSCADCHQGRSALGPDLAGVAKRFSRNDLLTAVLDPSRDVSTRYATTAIATTSGKTYTGLVIYDSVDGITLRDSMNRTIRIEADEIESRSTSSASLMPTGLLEGLTQQDWADLFAYLSKL